MSVVFQEKAGKYKYEPLRFAMEIGVSLVCFFYHAIDANWYAMKLNKRNSCRRFANLESLKEIRRVLKPNGYFVMIWHVEDCQYFPQLPTPDVATFISSLKTTKNTEKSMPTKPIQSRAIGKAWSNPSSGPTTTMFRAFATGYGETCSMTRIRPFLKLLFTKSTNRTRSGALRMLYGGGWWRSACFRLLMRRF